MNAHAIAAEVVRRLPALAADNAQNAATVIESLIAEAESKDILKSSLATTQRTLRDEFAMAALTCVGANFTQFNPDAIAKRALLIADSMMSARK